MKLIDVSKHLENEKARKKDYSICSLSVMDNLSDPNITYDNNSICNYYYDYLKYSQNLIKNIQIRMRSYLKRLIR